MILEEKKIARSLFFNNYLSFINSVRTAIVSNVSSVYDILPTQTNLCIWKLSEDPLCKLCGKRATLEHVLSACTKALADGRYTWRHNKVLENGIEKNSLCHKLCV